MRFSAFVCLFYSNILFSYNSYYVQQNEVVVEELEDKTCRDGNGTELLTGDSVTLIKDLKVHGSSTILKRGTKVKFIRLTEDPEEVDCKIDGTSFVLKTCFLKK